MRTLTRLCALPHSIWLAALLTTFVTSTACTGGSAQGGGEQKPPGHPDAQTAATRGLDTLRKLVTADNARDMGFESSAEAASATLTEPTRVQMVRLDALREFAPGSDPNRLLTDKSQVIYPVAVKQQVKSSIVVEESGNQWRASSFGGPHLARQIARYRTEVAERYKPDAEVTVVHVAALNLYFLGYRVGGRLMLTPLENHTEYRLEAGSSLPAEQVFATLAPISRSYNGLPL